MFRYAKCRDRKRMPLHLALAAAAIGVASCSDVPQRPAEVPQIRSAAAQAITINRDEKVKVSGWANRVVRAGTHWRYVGSLPQGDVYKPTDSTFTVEGSNIHEAYLVVKDGALVGYYLPVEQTISLMDRPVKLDFVSN